MLAIGSSFSLKRREVRGTQRIAYRLSVTAWWSLKSERKLREIGVGMLAEGPGWPLKEVRLVIGRKILGLMVRGVVSF
jgi:hypothetical protein